VLVFEDRDDTAAAMYMQSQHVTLAGQSSASSSELAPAIGSVSFVAARVIGRISEPLSCARPACGERPTRRSCGRAAGRGVAAPGSTRRLAEAAWSRRDTKLESQWHGTRLRSAGSRRKQLARQAARWVSGRASAAARGMGNGRQATQRWPAGCGGAAAGCPRCPGACPARTARAARAS
jgi:hypothetical protein